MAADRLIDAFGAVITVLAILFLCGAMASAKAQPGRLRAFLVGGLLARIMVAFAYILVLDGVYGGGGDVSAYLEQAKLLVVFVRDLDAAALLNADNWGRPELIGTQAVFIMIAILMGVIGTLDYVIAAWFAMIGFLGAFLAIRAFQISYPERDPIWFAGLVLFVPSLLFWTGAIGKDSLALFAVGAVMFGLARGGVFGLVSITGALSLAYAFRPMFALMLLFAVLGALVIALLANGGRRRLAPLLVCVAAVGVALLLSPIGTDLISISGIEENLSNARALGGASQITAPSIGAVGAIAGVGNVLLRPYPWEARSPQMVLAALELLVLWLLIGKQLLGAKMTVPRDRLFWFSILIVVALVFGLGLAGSNLGLIVRQRSVILPPAFLVLSCLLTVSIRSRQPIQRRTNQSRSSRSRPTIGQQRVRGTP